MLRTLIATPQPKGLAMSIRLLPAIVTAFVVAALMVSPSASAAAPQASSLEKVSNVVQPGIVYLETTYRAHVVDTYLNYALNEGRPFEATSSCSGFFVNPDGYFVSAGHCVDTGDGRDAVLIEAAQWSYENEPWPAGTTIDDVLEYAYNNFRVRSEEDPRLRKVDREVAAAYGVEVGGIPTGKALPARVLGANSFEKGDVALLKLEAENVPVLQLATKAEPRVGTEVVSVGYPGSVDYVTDQTFDPSFKEGTVSSEKTLDGGLRKVFEVSAAIAGGQSGGPTVDLSGRVIGVNSFGATAETEAFNFVSPASEVEQLLADEGVENRLGRTNQLYRDGLRAYYAGDREEALASFDELLGLVREHEFAQEFRARALRLQKAEEASVPVAPIGIGIGALVTLAGTLVLIRRRRGGSGSAPAPVAPSGGPSPEPSWQMPAPAPRVPAEEVHSPQMTVVNGGNGSSNGVPILLGIAGSRAGERFPLEESLVLGRGHVDVVIDDAKVSRRHAELTPVDGRIQIMDLGSVNGTAVNGIPLGGPVWLNDGDVIELGDTSFQLEAHSVPDARDQVTIVRSVPG
jgi:serine protease Do